MPGLRRGSASFKYKQSKFVYEVDFRNNSITNLKSEGWTFRDESEIRINSNGFSCKEHDSGAYFPLSFVGSKKITIESLCYHTGGSWNGVGIYKAESGSYLISAFYCGHQDGSYTNYSGYGITAEGIGYTETNTAVRGAFSNGDYNLKLEIDLTTKIATLTGFPQTVTRTLTDDEVNALTNPERIYVEPSGYDLQICCTFKVTVE